MLIISLKEKVLDLEIFCLGITAECAGIDFIEYPVFEDPTPSTTIYMAVGETRNLNCNATGSPSPTITLTKQTTTRRGVGSRDERNLLQLNGKYSLVNAAASDFGTYVCTAKNGLGTVKKQIKVVRGGIFIVYMICKRFRLYCVCVSYPVF